MFKGASCLVMLTFMQIYCNSDETKLMVWKQKMFIGLRAPSRIKCGSLALKFKSNLPIPADQIEVVGLKCDKSNPSKIYKKGSCSLVQFPQGGIKFDRPGWSDNHFYQICFATKRTVSGQPWSFLPVDDIVQDIIVEPARFCLNVSTPYPPLNLSTGITTGEAITLGTAAAVLVAGTGVAIAYTQVKKAEDKKASDTAKKGFEFVEKSVSGIENQIDTLDINKLSPDGQKKVEELRTKLDSLRKKIQEAEENENSQLLGSYHQEAATLQADYKKVKDAAGEHTVQPTPKPVVKQKDLALKELEDSNFDKGFDLGLNLGRFKETLAPNTDFARRVEELETRHNDIFGQLQEAKDNKEKQNQYAHDFERIEKDFDTLKKDLLQYPKSN